MFRPIYNPYVLSKTFEWLVSLQLLLSWTLSWTLCTSSIQPFWLYNQPLHWNCSSLSTFWYLPINWQIPIFSVCSFWCFGCLRCGRPSNPTRAPWNLVWHQAPPSPLVHILHAYLTASIIIIRRFIKRRSSAEGKGAVYCVHRAGSAYSGALG